MGRPTDLTTGQRAAAWARTPSFAKSTAPQALTDRWGRFLATNRAFRELLGYDEPELSRLRVHDLIHPGDRPSSREAGHRLWASEEVVAHDQRYVRKDGNPCPVRVHATLVPAEGAAEPYTHAYVEDRRDLQELAAELRRTTAAARELADGLVEAVVELAFDGTVRWATPSARRLLGSQVKQLYAGLLVVAHPEEVSSVREALSAVVDAHAGSATARFRAVRRGSIRHLELRVSRGQSFSVPTLIVHLRDRTEEVQAEALLAGELRVIARIGQEASREAILFELAALVETLEPDALCALLAVDPAGSSLRYAAAPSLPAGYVRATDGLRIGPAAGSWGAAVHRGRTVVTEDVRADPLWIGLRDAAALAGIVACWALPITGEGGRVLGALTISRRAPGRPSDQEWWLVHRCAVLASAVLTVVGPHAAPTPAASASDDLAALSPREREVLELVALGHTNSEIGRQMELSVRTVESHRAKMAHKLGAQTRAELVAVALRAGLLRDASAAGNPK